MAEVIEHRRSSYIAETSYDQPNEVLDVTFNDGSTWRYEGVPRSRYTQLITSPSIGRAFHALIRDSYEGEEI